jgi:hypothetical protein
MPAARRRILAAVLACVAGACAAGAAFAATSDPTVDPNPCHGPKRKQLLCPNLQMSPPADVWVEHTGGRVLLHGQNSINSRGHGPAELRGHRSGRVTMQAVQVIHKTNGGVMYVDTHAFLGFKSIPGQGSYWKFRNAGVFKLWSVDKSDTPLKQVRTGEKQYYCLRDLKRTKPGKLSPRGAVYPRCNQNAGAQRVTVGTSVGWSDVYPSRYYEQFIDVTGLHGRFGFFQVADPNNGIWESNESDNAGETVVSLPSGRVLATHGPIDRPHRP